MKNVLIVIPSFNHGGTNRSLLNLLNTKSFPDLNIKILPLVAKGPYKERFNSFDVLSEILPLTALFSYKATSHGDSFLKKTKKALWKIIYRIIFKNQSSKLYQYVIKRRFKNDFDIVIAFQEGITSEFVSYIPAKKRIAWVRCDYNNYLKLACKKSEKHIYEKFDKIVCVSKYTSRIFANCYPELKNRVESIYNVIDTEGILNSSRININDKEFSDNIFTIVSIGRMDPVKRFTVIPEIAKLINENGCIFKWYIIGSGGTEFEKVKDGISENNVEEQVIMLGAQNNPYPYIDKANILVCTSISEACPNVINEAKILHTPVVTADFPTAYEYIENGVNGIICSINKMADIITQLYKDKSFYNIILNGISNFEYKNDTIIKQLETLFS